VIRFLQTVGATTKKRTAGRRQGISKAFQAERGALSDPLPIKNNENRRETAPGFRRARDPGVKKVPGTELEPKKGEKGGGV